MNPAQRERRRAIAQGKGNDVADGPQELTDEQRQALAQVSDGPVPMMREIVVQPVMTSEGVVQMVRLNQKSRTGYHVDFMTPDDAELIARTLRRAAKQARTGLILPQNGLHSVDDGQDDDDGDH